MCDNEECECGDNSAEDVTPSGVDDKPCDCDKAGVADEAYQNTIGPSLARILEAAESAGMKMGVVFEYDGEGCWQTQLTVLGGRPRLYARESDGKPVCKRSIGFKPSTEQK